jgi:acyl-homoserine-lactone acylase
MAALLVWWVRCAMRRDCSIAAIPHPHQRSYAWHWFQETRLKKNFVLLLAATAVLASCAVQTPVATPNAEQSAWRARAQTINIIRDDWGIAHIHGKTDADAVFGMAYAQAEDDFNRIETNYLNAMGRLAEAEGEKEIYRDLRMKLYINPAKLQALYRQSPPWLQALMVAWADGLNLYLATHPTVKPRVISRFEPWMALSFSEGSIGGDIERIDLAQLKAFYSGDPKDKQLAVNEAMPALAEPTGSNGFAIAPSRSASGHALLWINPHTSFFFRAEQQVSSEEGLNAYGAATWGQFFIYQGFNERLGWMHTSSGVDNIDEYLETVRRQGDGYVVRYGGQELPVSSETIRVPYKTADGMAYQDFTVYRTQHGPVVRQAVDGKWVSVRLMDAPMQALTQSYSRTKARNLKEFRAALDLHANSSNNTVYADADGNIAYFHANFIPKRDNRFDWTQPVDGSDPATDWGPPLTVEESPLSVNPPSGWLQNTNNWPFTVAGPYSPKQKDFPRYVEAGSENPRGLHAMRVLSHTRDFTPDALVGAAFDSYQPEFAVLVPNLVKAYDALPAGHALKTRLAEQIALLRAWDYRWGVDSVANTLAQFWGEDLWKRLAPEARKAKLPMYEYIETRASAQQQLDALAAASTKLVADFGRWNIAWGEVNRFQRLSDDIVHPFNDAAPSIPVAFASSRWGSLAAFGAGPHNGSKKWYGTTGNSFLAVVEFGPTVKAKAVSAGGQSGDPASKHFNDQAQRYADGQLREVYFYPQQLLGHTERSYHPGE